MQSYCLFETAIGACALVWRPQGIIGTFLPESRREHLIERLERKFPNAQENRAPEDHDATIRRIVAHLSGTPDDLADVALDESGIAAFDHAVYRIARAIPIGEVLTYGEVASELGAKDSAREVGQALGRNPFPIIVPCHRVLAAGGKIGGFSAPGGISTKRRLLAIESEMAPPKATAAQYRLI